MDAILSIAGIIGLWVFALRPPRWLIVDWQTTGGREWPRGVQEEEPAPWAFDRLAPRRSSGVVSRAATEPVAGPVVVAWH